MREASSEPAVRVASCAAARSEEHTSELQSRSDLVCRLLLEKKKKCMIRFLKTQVIGFVLTRPVARKQCSVAVSSKRSGGNTDTCLLHRVRRTSDRFLPSLVIFHLASVGHES